MLGIMDIYYCTVLYVTCTGIYGYKKKDIEQLLKF